MELSSTINVSLIKFEQILRSMLFKMLGFPVVIIHFSSTLIRVPKYIVVCKPNSHFLPYWFCIEGGTQIGPWWLYMILSLYWSDFQTVLVLGIINDKPNRWVSEYLFMYINQNIYKYTLGETKDFSTLGSPWKPEAMSVLWVHSLVCAWYETIANMWSRHSGLFTRNPGIIFWYVWRNLGFFFFFLNYLCML